MPHERYFEPFQILRYEPGQFYRVHHDQNCGLFTPQGAHVREHGPPPSTRSDPQL